MKFFTLVLFFSISFSAMAQNAAFIYRDSILLSMDDLQKNLTSHNSQINDYKKEINDLQTSHEEKVTSLLSGYQISQQDDLDTIKAKLSEEDQKKFDILVEESEYIQKKAKGYEGLIADNYSKNIQPTFDRVNSTINKYAKSKKIDFVYIMEEQPGRFAYINTKKDITKAIISSLK